MEHARQFEVGKTYSTRSICDHDTIYRFKILARTAETVTFGDRQGKTQRRGIYIYEGVEQFRPHGRGSMCAIIGADDEGEPR
jgi:hypothetical protein